jgi:hypothetical protein
MWSSVSIQIQELEVTIYSHVFGEFDALAHNIHVTEKRFYFSQFLMSENVTSKQWISHKAFELSKYLQDANT